jgi:hypothetical protein
MRKVAGYAAAAAVMGLLAWLPFQQGVVDGSKSLMAEMGLMPHAQRSVYAPRKFHPVQLSMDPSAMEHENMRTVSSLDEVPSINWEQAEMPSFYHVIAASFQTMKEAEIMVGKLQQRGFQSELTSGPDNLFRVSYGRYESVAIAESMLASVRISNPNAVIVPAN